MRLPPHIASFTKLLLHTRLSIKERSGLEMKGQPGRYIIVYKNRNIYKMRWPTDLKAVRLRLSSGWEECEE
jgi:hypothetical protein